MACRKQSGAADIFCKRKTSAGNCGLCLRGRRPPTHPGTYGSRRCCLCCNCLQTCRHEAKQNVLSATVPSALTPYCEYFLSPVTREQWAEDWTNWQWHLVQPVPPGIPGPQNPVSISHGCVKEKGAALPSVSRSANRALEVLREASLQKSVRPCVSPAPTSEPAAMPGSLCTTDLLQRAESPHQGRAPRVLGILQFGGLQCPREGQAC